MVEGGCGDGLQVEWVTVAGGYGDGLHVRVGDD